jgi:hypothetical protein
MRQVLPGFQIDVARLRAVTNSELARVANHGRLPLGAGVPITRESDAPLAAAILDGSLLIAGEPGADNTGGPCPCRRGEAGFGCALEDRGGFDIRSIQ